MKPLTLLVAFAALLAVAAPAAADRFRLNSSDGALFIDITPDGSVRGFYPNKQGRIRGRMQPDGSIRGIWLQPDSDYPCPVPRGDTYAWGYFWLSNPYDWRLAGSWGYCEEPPERNWHIERN